MKTLPAHLDRLSASLDALRRALAALEPSLERAWRGWTLVPVLALALWSFVESSGGAAWAQSNPGWTDQQHINAPMWNIQWSTKLDVDALGVDVKTAGAKCDGVTDDYPAISAAASQAGSGNVKAVYFPPSATKCLLSQRVNIPAGVCVVSQPGAATIAPTAGNVSSPLLLNFNTVSAACVYGLVIDGGGQDFPNAANVVQAFSGDHVILDSVTIQHTRGIGFLLSTSMTNSGVRNSTFKDVGNHWKTTLSVADRAQGVAFCCGTTASNFGNFATGNYFADIGLDAVSATAQNDLLVSGNRFELQNNQIATVTSTNYPAAVYVSASFSAVVNGNTINGAQGNGIDSNTTSNIVISGNYVMNGGQSGIALGTVANATISGNMTQGNGLWTGSVHRGGIDLGGANGNVTLAGNVSYGNLYGVQGFTYLTVPPSFTSLHIDQSNILDGNATANVGGITTYATNAICNSGSSPAAPAC